MKEKKPRKSPMTEKEERRARWLRVEKGEKDTVKDNHMLLHFGFSDI